MVNRLLVQVKKLDCTQSRIGLSHMFISLTVVTTLIELEIGLV